MALPATLTLRQAVLDRLALVDDITVYDGAVPSTPPLIPGTALVAAYAVLHSGGGSAFSDRIVGPPSALGWTPQINVVAGHPANCLQAVDRIRAELSGKPITIPDGSTGYLREPEGDRPLFEDRDQEPSRWVFPLIFQTVATP